MGGIRGGGRLRYRCRPFVGRGEAVFGGVGASRQRDSDRIRASFVCVVLDEAPTQPSGLDADQRIGLRVKIGRTAEHLDADRVALEPLPAARERFFDDEAKKFRCAAGLLKATALQNPIESVADVARCGLRRTAVVA